MNHKIQIDLTNGQALQAMLCFLRILAGLVNLICHDLSQSDGGFL